MSKIKLHEAVQKEYGSSPSYTFAKDGPDHAPQFRAFVGFCGLTFQSPGFCRTMRQAENAAAEVALVALGKPDDEPMQTDDPIQTKEPRQTNGPAVTVQIQSGEVHPNLQKEGNKDETPRPHGNVPSSSESGITIALPTSEHKERTAQIPQTHPQSFPTSRIHVVPFRELSTSEYSGRGTNKQSIDNINSVSANSGNGTNKEPGHDVAAGMLGKRQRTEAIIQPEERISTPVLLPELQKTQLLNYAVKYGVDLPVYSCIHEVVSHVPRFKATVKFNGQTFESSGYFNTVRQAEHAAASVALKSLSERGFGLVESPPYKNCLQMKAQKEGRPLPVYSTTMSGQGHRPVFTSTLKFNGMEFKGKAAKTKKQAENNAASVALYALKELIGSAVSTLPVQDDKGKAPVCESNEHPLIQAINHLKEETTRVGSNGELSHSDLSTSLSEVSLFEPSETYKAQSKKELVQNMNTNVLGNSLEDNVKQACKTDSKKELVQNMSNLSEVSLVEPSEILKTESDKDLVQNMNTNVLGNRVEDNVQQVCKTDLKKELVENTNLSKVSLVEPSEIFRTESNKELIQNMTRSVPENRVNDNVQEPCNRLWLSHTKFSSGTRIRIIPASEAFSTKPWVAMNLTASSMTGQNGAPEA